MIRSVEKLDFGVGDLRRHLLTFQESSEDSKVIFMDELAAQWQGSPEAMKALREELMRRNGTS